MVKKRSLGFRSTRQLARLLGIKVGRLSAAVWDGRIYEPLRSPEGHFLWSIDDIRHASWVILHQDFDPEALVGDELAI